MCTGCSQEWRTFHSIKPQQGPGRPGPCRGGARQSAQARLLLLGAAASWLGVGDGTGGLGRGSASQTRWSGRSGVTVDICPSAKLPGLCRNLPSTGPGHLVACAPPLGPSCCSMGDKAQLQCTSTRKSRQQGPGAAPSLARQSWLQDQGTSRRPVGIVKNSPSGWSLAPGNRSLPV